ncbi:hypothetical protein PsYK624_105600 [Phanerochaete sordida]|uniref:SHSP domain-containing protein n=1 Tax=Phanerochaete sordida TaxID=48140 RepID=A0A9P3LGB3_9APHY|nr:hypothetical protein PsYK624_105600 [Phanerochaete sordida]
MPLQRQPPPSSDDARHPLSPKPSFSSTSSTSTSSTSASDSSSLATPFENLHLREDARPEAQKALQEDVLIDEDLDSDVNMLERMSRASTPSSPSHRTRPLLQHFHTQYYPRSPTAERPPLLHRNTSYSKRTASFDSPREVPLPYMPSQIHNISHSPSSSRILAHDGADEVSSPTQGPSDLSSGPPSPSAPTVLEQQRSQSHSPTPHYMDTSDDIVIQQSAPARTSPSESRAPDRHQHHQYRRSMASPVQLYGRPLSTPETPSSAQIFSPKPVRAAPPPDNTSRSSTLSLPLPMDTPYHTLPSLQGSSTGSIPGGQSAGPPPTASTPSSHTYPQASSSRRPAYMIQEAPPQANPPDWLREFSESRRNMSPSSMEGISMGLPPQPPTVLTPPPPPQTGAPHESFLSHAPPPQDSYVVIKTGPTEYTLLVRLPGYGRDSITLSTRRRRILHIVADSWEPGGGHFERRISFGYDADLACVRAEFDGEHLRVSVPRRQASMTYWGGRT